MICIISGAGDYNANSIINWLHSFQCNYIRIDLAEESFKNIQVKFNDKETDISFTLNRGKTFRLSDVSYFLYRGGYFKDDTSDIHYPEHIPDNAIENHLRIESDTLIGFFYEEVAKKCIGMPAQKPLNKLTQLMLAQSVGLQVPKTMLTSDKSRAQQYYSNSRVINKAIQEAFQHQEDNQFYYTRTEEEQLSNLDDRFFPALFQEYIAKWYEIRTFFLDGECYSICMKHTEKSDNIDYRDHYDSMIYEPYQLPAVIEGKLGMLMKRLNLISGSIDWIRREDGEYVFIEVNTQGQYDWVSQLGNYGLHKRIAQFLCKQESIFKGYDSKKTSRANPIKGESA